MQKGMATHSSILAWRIPWTEEPGRLQSMGLQRIRHDLATNTNTYIYAYCTWISVFFFRFGSFQLKCLQMHFQSLFFWKPTLLFSKWGDGSEIESHSVVSDPLRPHGL